MKAAKGSIPRALDKPDPSIRFYLFYGPDEGQSQAHGERLLAALGASKQALQAGAIRSDGAVLADAAGAISLFGDRQAIWIQPAGDEIAEAVEALLAAAAVENAVIAIGGALRKTSALVKLADAHPLALSHASYAPEGRGAEAMIDELARAEGLRPLPGVAARIAEACDNDRRIAAQELAKFALYLDASPQRPRDLGEEVLDAVGVEMGGDFLRIADLALSGELRELAEELARLPSGGGEAIPVLRSLQRRILMLAPMRARVERGDRLDDVMASAGKALFWKDKPLVGKLLRQWDAAGLARVAERAGAIEREMMLAGLPPVEALGEELTAIARTAARRR